MKKNFYFLIIFFQFYTTYASCENKIYYLDMNYIINKSIPGKSILKKIEDFKIQQTNYLKKKEDLIKVKQNELNTQKNILSEEEINQRVNNLDNDIKKFNIERKDLINDFEIKKKEELDKLVTKISKILEVFMKENSIEYIFNQSNILIASSKFNLNEKILNLVNEKIKVND
tara:strand:- start:972 stop:1487 length:516 start_codon:yes stop_codon:yes gene_type:complete